MILRNRSSTGRRTEGLLAMALIMLPAVTGNAQSRAPAHRLLDHGVAVPLAERRGVVTTQDRNGRNLVIGCSLDTSPRGWILVTDVDTEETTQIHFPEGVSNAPPYGSILAASGRFYTGAGSVLLEFDPTTEAWIYHGRPFPGATCYLSFTEAPDGMIWAGTYPAALVSFDPKTREATNHGLLDPHEKYLSSLAVDDEGWVYGGIGTQRCNLVAYNPRTQEKRQLVPEEKRKVGSASVYRGADGKAYARADLTDGGHVYRLSGGDVTEIAQADMGKKARTGAIYWGDMGGTFPDGRELVSYSMVEQHLTVRDPRTKRVSRTEFDYESEGSIIRVITRGPDGKVYGNSAHPSRNFVCDPDSNTPTYRSGAIAVKGYAVQGNCVIGGHYGGGKLYIYDTTEPWHMREQPPRLLEGLRARELVQRATSEDGRMHYIDAHDIVLFRAEEYGTEVTFRLEVPEAGAYHLLIAPYQSPGYCTVQFLLDGQRVGRTYEGNHAVVGPGPIQTIGPFQLDAGKHQLGVRTLDAGVGNPWIGLSAVCLTRENPAGLITDRQPANPYLACAFAPDINVPWGACAHPDGRHVMISGQPGYGNVGGGIGIYNLESKQTQLLTHEQLIPGHSVMAMTPLTSGDIACGTSIAGGHGTRAAAKSAVLFILDWQTKTVQSRLAAPKGAREIGLLARGPDGLIYGTADKAVFVVDVTRNEVLHTTDSSDYGSRAVNGMALGDDGNIYLVFTKAVLRIKPRTFEIEKIIDTPGNANAGIAVTAGCVYFAVGSHLWSVALQP